VFKLHLLLLKKIYTIYWKNGNKIFLDFEVVKNKFVKLFVNQIDTVYYEWTEKIFPEQDEAVFDVYKEVFKPWTTFQVHKEELKAVPNGERFLGTPQGEGFHDLSEIYTQEILHTR
jgi:hypothetical protein